MTATEADPTTYKGKHRGRLTFSTFGEVLAARYYVGKHHPAFCDWCDSRVVEPVRDDEAVAWLGAGAPTWCSDACMEAQSEHAINADGNR